MPLTEERSTTLLAKPALPAGPGSSPTLGRTVRKRALDSLDPPADRLLDDATQFDFFQAVWLLERMDAERRPVGFDGAPSGEVVRFRAHQSLSFPPSSVYDLKSADGAQGHAAENLRLPLAAAAQPRMTVTFMGLTGSSGVLPRHYTELLLRLEREAKGSEKHALREWLDLFNHRLISLFFRAWEKYRFFVPFSRRHGPPGNEETFTTALRSLIGLGQPALRGRLRVSAWHADGETEHALAGVDDLGTLRYAGILAQRPRTAANLEQLLSDYFSVPVQARQFQQQWLLLESPQQTRIGLLDGNCQLGVSALAGQRVSDIQGLVRLRLGPLSLEQFNEFLPSRQIDPRGKAQFLLAHLTRLYIGPETDFQVQLILRARDVPQCRLTGSEPEAPRLGWNTWLSSQPTMQDAGDATFVGDAIRWL